MDVGLFIRVSTVDQAKGESPKIHEERGMLYAKSKGWNVVRVYNLAGVSGKSTRYHSQTEKMLADVEDGTITGLIFSQLSRLARNTEELLYYANYFEKYNASLISLNESIDTSSSSGKFFYTILGALSTWERENNLDRIMASIETRRALGKFTGGQVSYGYKIENGQVVVNEEESPVRVLMYELFLKYKRKSTVAKKLNEMGYRTRRNLKWSDVTVSRLLKNSDAKGIRKSNYRRKPTADNPDFRKPKDEWRYDPCPAIVSEEKWNAVNALLSEQENSLLTKPLNQRTNLFTGFIYCDKEHKMLMHAGTQKYSCPKCKLRIEVKTLEEIFKSRIEKFLISQEEINEYLKSSDKELRNKSDELETARKTLLDIDKKLDQLIELNLQGQIPTKGFKKHYEPINEQKEQLEKTIQLQEQRLEEMKLGRSSVSEVITKSKELYSRWNTLEKYEKRQIVEAVTNKVIFDGQSINFKLKQIAPISSPKELSTDGQHIGGYG